MTDSGIVPPKRPACTRAFVEALIEDAGYTDKLAIVGRRGYFHQAGDDPQGNDFGIYDDAIFLLSPTEFLAFNANTDPSKRKPGQAVLQPGRFYYAAGVHNRSKTVERQYRALVQVSPVTILRVGDPVPEVGFFGINIHRGGLHTTGSEGCQTIYPDQWTDFMESYDRIVQAAAVKKLPYILSAFPRAVAA